MNKMLPQAKISSICRLDQVCMTQERMQETLIIKFFQTDADGTAKIGTYLGISMNIAFDSFNRKFVLRLKGAMNHPVEIGPDPVGNIIRFEQCFENHDRISLPKPKTDLKP